MTPVLRRRLTWLIVIVLLIAVSIALLLWWRMWQGTIELGPVSGNLSRIESSENSSSTMSTSGGPDRRLAVRRIALMTHGDHPLLLKVAPLVRDELAKLPFAEEVQLLEADGQPQGEARLPDLLVQLALSGVKESSTLHERKLEATFNIAMSTGLQSSNHYYTDGLTPPIVEIDFNGELDHQSTSIGDGVGDQRYRLTAPKIAGEIAKKLSEPLKKLNTDNGSLPQLPDAFYGPYRAVPSEVASIPQIASPPIVTGYGLLNHNETLWEFQSDEDPVPLLKGIAEALKPHGWRGGPDPSTIYLRMTKGPAVLTVYTPRQRDGDPVPTSGPAARRYHIRYIDRFGRDEIDAAFRSAGKTISPELLIIFERQLGPELHRQLIEQLEASPASSAVASVLLAEHYRADNPELAMKHLRRAAILDIAAGDEGYSGRIKSLSKELGLKEPRLADFTADDLRAMQVPELTSSTPLTGNVAAGEWFTAFAPTKEGKAALMCLKITPASNPADGPWEVTCALAQEHGRSSSRRGGRTNSANQWTAEGSSGFNDLSITWTAKQLPDGRFEIVITAPEQERPSTTPVEQAQ